MFRQVALVLPKVRRMFVVVRLIERGQLSVESRVFLVQRIGALLQTFVFFTLGFSHTGTNMPVHRPTRVDSELSRSGHHEPKTTHRMRPGPQQSWEGRSL